MNERGPKSKIGEITGAELYEKVRETLLRKFQAKKKFFNVPSIENSAMLEMTSYIFNKIIKDIYKQHDIDVNTKTAKENYEQIFDMHQTEDEFKNNIWQEMSDINEYEAIKQGGLTKYSIDLFKPEMLSVIKDKKQKPEERWVEPINTNPPIGGWQKKWENDNDK